MVSMQIWSFDENYANENFNTYKKPQMVLKMVSKQLSS